MKRKFNLLLATACLAVAVHSASAEERQLWTDGHGDLQVGYDNGVWNWGAWLTSSPDEVSISLTEDSKVFIPDNSSFDFLGQPGDPLWIAPQVDKEGVVFLGINTSSTSIGTFEGNRFDLKLSSVSGPGDFFMWITGGAGTVEVPMNSRDGIDENDRVDAAAPGHFHENWGFTSPGTYHVGFSVEGTLAGQSNPIMSDEQIYQFAVNVFDHGELDMEVAYEDGEWELVLLDEANEKEIEAGDAALHVGPETWQTVPSDPAFAFLGNPGDGIYILPQDEEEGVLFLGIAGDEIESGVFENDQVGLNLNSVSGPGAVYLYSTDEFGSPTKYFDSADGISDEDQFPVSVGGHSHQNWAFSTPGIYRVGLNASGVLANGTAVASESIEFLFEVFGPTIFGEGELDLEVAFEDGEWELVGLDEANEQEICANELVIQGSAATQTVVPEDPAFSFLGAPGDRVNVLPQEEAEGVIFLGIAGDEIEAGVFEGDVVQLHLVSTTGPGQVSLYAVDEFGSPSVFFNSADGISDSDLFPVNVGGHSHQAWGFTQPGLYRVGLQAAGQVAGESAVSTSEVVEFRFNIQADSPVVAPALPSFTFERFDIEGSTGTTLFGINNDGVIVGRYLDAEGLSYALILENGAVEFFSVTETTRTLALGIDSLGQITGIYEDPNDSAVQHGFLRGLDGSFIDIDHPAEDFNYAWGINDSGQIAGYFFEDEPFMIRAWQRESNGEFGEPFVFPDVGLGAVSRGINDNAVRAGWKWREDFSVAGFLYENGEFIEFFDIDGLPNTLPSDINNIGDTVGNANTASVSADGFIRAANGSSRRFKVPGSAQTFAYGINDHRQIVGEWQDAKGTNHGFIASPAAQLDSGEIDLEIAYEDGEWEIVFLDEVNESEIELGDGVLTALEAAETLVPEDEMFEFMHPEGRPIWILPQEENSELLFLGAAGDEIASGVFQDDQVALSLVNARGPGEVFFYKVDEFGIPTVFFNSRDGISESDLFPVPVGGHTHNNWGFTAPGIYELDVQASGVLAENGSVSSSSVATLTFEVFGELPDVLPEPEIEIDVAFEEGQWEIELVDALTLTSFPAEELPLNLTTAAEAHIPDDPAFGFLGTSGDPFYLIPQSRNTEVLFLGVAGEGIAGGSFVDGVVNLSVVSVDGPGELFVYETDSFGQPTVFADSSDGLDSLDFYPVPVGGHNHANWGFSKRGDYKIGLQASGIPTGTTEISLSDIAVISIAVAPQERFAAGEIDLEVAFEEGEFELVLFDEVNEREIDSADGILVGAASTLEPVPNEPTFGFLGDPGDRIFILPQDEQESVLFLGIAGDEIPAGEFENDSVGLNLVGVDGPGNVFLYGTDEFGIPTTYYNSANGIDGEDVFPVSVGGHSHQNWGFSAAGQYEVSLQASGVTASGGENLQSDAVSFFFEVIEPEVFNQGELDIEVVYEGGEWELALLDEANEREVEPSDALLQGVAATRQAVPDDPAFGFLGSAGSGVWVLPQEETEGVLFLGIAGDEIESGVFENDSVDLQLVGVRGPGDVSLYSVDEFGAPTVFFNSGDKLDDGDRFPVSVGGHSHQNWGFTAPGVYKIALQAAGTPVAGSEQIQSEVIEFAFEIESKANKLSIAFEVDGALVLSWPTVAGKAYQIESIAAFDGGQWAADGDAVSGTGQTIVRVIPVSEQTASMFYRIVEGLIGGQ
jgi:surface-anchored protein